MSVTLPPEGQYTEAELRWIEDEPAGLLPSDQTSLWGQARKVFADYIQGNLLDELTRIVANMDPSTCDEDGIENWEIELGIPVDKSKSLAARRAFVQARRQKGAFTRTRRRLIVESFILATQGDPITFGTFGVPFTDDGIPFYAGEFDLDGTYEIIEDVPNFTYDVRILNTIAVDEAGLHRELYRVTPAPIDDNFSITFVSSL